MKIISSLLLVSFFMVFSIKCSFASLIIDHLSNAVILVEYYDYECQHCRHMESAIQQLQASYPDLQVIHRVTPLLNDDSYRVANFTLAVQSQDGWQAWRALNSRLMQLPEAPTLDDTEAIAAELGLDVAAILKRIRQSDIQVQIRNNIDLAETYSMSGQLRLPLLVFGLSHGREQQIVLRGEQPYGLLSAIVQQLLDNQHVQLAKTLKKMQISR